VTPAVEAGGVPLAYEERGDGEPLLLVHGTACDRSVWEELLEALPGGLRAIAYDRRAYGGSGTPEPYGGTTVEEQADDAAELLEALNAAPALLCGHDLGALVCLDLLRRRPDLARGAVLVGPPLLALTPRGPEVMSELREAVRQGAADGGPAGAVEAFLVELGGERALDLLGARRLEAATGAARAFAADLAAAPRWSFARRELRAVEGPVVVLAGLHGGAWREPAVALAGLLPGARLVEVEAGHFVPLERPEIVAESIAELSGHEALRP
jgi:pimeloyl-ACP methyl ester carboxylesterase